MNQKQNTQNREMAQRSPKSDHIKKFANRSFQFQTEQKSEFHNSLQPTQPILRI